jgi:hypothetical protein
MAAPPTPMRNDDFRKLLATPRAPASGVPAAATFGGPVSSSSSSSSSSSFAKPAALTEADKKKREKATRCV